MSADEIVAHVIGGNPNDMSGSRGFHADLLPWGILVLGVGLAYSPAPAPANDVCFYVIVMLGWLAENGQFSSIDVRSADYAGRQNNLRP
jgi:hypothetical protein